jgi:hypothetical protein
MNHTYHIVTPFSRPQNFERLREMLRPHSVKWHLLMNDPPGFEVDLSEPWMSANYFQTVKPAWMMWRKCINRFAEMMDSVPGHPADDDRYCILADDCAYEPEFFSKIDAIKGPVVIASLKRGHQIPPGTPPEFSHGTNTLVAAPENMHPFQVSAEQIVLPGRLFRRLNLILHPASDGYMIEAMVHDHGASYAPEAFVWFNYYEPGRWNGVALHQKRS